MSFKNDIFHNDYSVYVSSLPVNPPTKEGFQEGALSSDLMNILVRYDSISGSVKTYKEKKADAISNENSDFKSDKLDFTNTTKTIYDGAQDDLQVMLVHQYNMYMAGLITTATLIVFAILIARE